MPQLPIAYLMMLFLSFSAVAQETINGSLVDLQTTNSLTWEHYITTETFSIDYQSATCESEVVSNQVLVLLRIVNLTDSELQITWNEEVWRNEACVNCTETIQGENTFSLALLPHQTLEGSCLSKTNKALYIFGNFIELVPGMSKQQLTHFRLINISHAFSAEH